MASFIAIGGSGTGKSTIGNFILNGTSEGSFATFKGVDSCTKVATTKTNSDGRTYTDTPGIPDTNPANTKAFYNECINALKKAHSVILFVFKYEKIDPAKLRTSKLLFREMNKANSMKFLIINNHNNYAFSTPPNEEEYRRLAEEITSYTQVSFHWVFNLCSQTMKQCVDSILECVKQREKLLASPELRNFDELGDWVNSLKNNANYLEAAIEEYKAALERAESEKQVLCKKSRWDQIRASVVQGFILGGTTSFFGFPVCVPTDLLRNEKIERALNVKEFEISIINDAKLKDEEVFQDAMKELKEATDSFDELRKAVEA
jgi:GTPase Era involved in 16S rRNA processing